MISDSSKIIVTSHQTGAVTLKKDNISYTSFNGNSAFLLLLLFEKSEYWAIMNGLYILALQLFKIL